MYKDEQEMTLSQKMSNLMEKKNTYLDDYN